MYLGRDAVTSRKRWAYRTFHGGKRDAQRALATMVAEAERGGLARTSATVGELLEEWFELAAPSFWLNASEPEIFPLWSLARP